jgi:hypothetical protein
VILIELVPRLSALCAGDERTGAPDKRGELTGWRTRCAQCLTSQSPDLTGVQSRNATIEPIASKLNTLPKNVGSHRRASFEWAGSSCVEDLAAEVPGVNERYSGELQVDGSSGHMEHPPAIPTLFALGTPWPMM